MKEGKEIIEAMIDGISELSKANILTGIWDNRRFQECKKPFTEIDCKYLYKTEKLSRLNVERRAVHRTRIDELFEQLLHLQKSGK